MKKIQIIENCQPDEINGHITLSEQPILLKGLVNNWPAVKTCKKSIPKTVQYLNYFYKNAELDALIGEPDIKGRFFYNKDNNGFNFTHSRTKLTTILDKIQKHQKDETPPAFYIGSTAIELCLPGFQRFNDLSISGADTTTSIWIGNQTRVAAHYDEPDNIACVVAGKRRFTLFPPDQIKNLYIGGLNNGPGGRSMSLVDFDAPDFDKYPKFQNALEHALIAELEPGDAIFIPSMWWHQVEGLKTLNILVNYWWTQQAKYIGSPYSAFKHSLMTIKDLPKGQRDSWFELFKHYIFDNNEDNYMHIPEHHKGMLNKLDKNAVKKLKTELLNSLK